MDTPACTTEKRGFRSGDTAYAQFLQSLSVANKIKFDYLDNLYLYNSTIQEIETLVGIQ